MYYKYSTLMGNLCKKEKSSDPNEIDDKTHTKKKIQKNLTICVVK